MAYSWMTPQTKFTMGKPYVYIPSHVLPVPPPWIRCGCRTRPAYHKPAIAIAIALPLRCHAIVSGSYWEKAGWYNIRSVSKDVLADGGSDDRVMGTVFYERPDYGQCTTLGPTTKPEPQHDTSHSQY